MPRRIGTALATAIVAWAISAALGLARAQDLIEYALMAGFVDP